ncbi:zinc-finger domain-containing protein [Kordiimonas sediminis]|uniref:Zinc-finger domain-containing protein n=1 Tax=Kordiimonas sediminis TaxID=1735581 RepID=A0A919E5H4_9PROT|nr:zinc-finger domain-containing protein [Kordiimonas sediminis]GHF14140.1 zinc-finger domain-containing protein [Kordiimonas sediminis]
MTLEAPETIRVKEKRVSCDGDEGALGHPRIYLNLGEDGKVECPYCDRLFILEGSDADKK